MFKNLFNKKTTEENKVLPRHIAIIMDGNGRWAKRRGLPRKAGHTAGAANFKKLAKYCNKIGLKYLTVYAFSTENWKRPADEVSAIMNLFKDYLNDVIDDLGKENIKIRFIGDTTVLDGSLRELITTAERVTGKATGLTVNIAVNYGGRQEIVMAAKSLCEDAVSGNIRPEDITEEKFSEKIYTSGQPDPDLIIRPSGEKRISNFLLFQSAYSEFWYSEIMWPDFTPEMLEQAITDYSKRKRRFGGL